MTGGVARSFEELDIASREFWKNASYTAKPQATHDALAERLDPSGTKWTSTPI